MSGDISDFLASDPDLPLCFPNLNPDVARRTSEEDPTYNCLAWAAGDARNWWDGNRYWPEGCKYKKTVEAFVKAFETKNYVKCADGALEEGFEKIAIYARAVADFQVPTHAARQLEDGRWASKLGKDIDIEHLTVDAMAGGAYGEPVCFMKRPRGAL